MPVELPEKTRKLLEAFKVAIEAEKNAQKMYSQLKELTDDDLLKQVFEGFHQDEVRHEQELMERYKELRQGFDLQDER